jgi:hypothetical protein
VSSLESQELRVSYCLQKYKILNYDIDCRPPMGPHERTLSTFRRQVRIDNAADDDHGRSLAGVIREGIAVAARATPNLLAAGRLAFADPRATPALGTIAMALLASMLLTQPLKAAEAALTCDWQSTGPGHEKRTFALSFDQHEQRAQIGSNASLPATISDSQISFSVNLSGSILLYSIDRSSGFGTITIRDKVMYSGMCKAADAAKRH